MFNIYGGGPNGEWRGDEDHTPEKYLNFIDLLRKMLMYDPDKRITPQEALEHQYFQDGNTNNSYRF